MLGQAHLGNQSKLRLVLGFRFSTAGIDDDAGVVVVLDKLRVRGGELRHVEATVNPAEVRIEAVEMNSAL